MGAENLHDRLIVQNPRDELGHLATSFNSLLDRLDQSFERQRRFVADASHELRTPIAILCGEAEVALSPARTLAAVLNAQIILIKVLPTGTAGLSVLSSPELDDSYDYLEGIAAELRATSVTVEVVVSRGGPADTIVAEVESHVVPPEFVYRRPGGATPKPAREKTPAPTEA